MPLMEILYVKNVLLIKKVVNKKNQLIFIKNLAIFQQNKPIAVDFIY